MKWLSWISAEIVYYSCGPAAIMLLLLQQYELAALAIAAVGVAAFLEWRSQK